MKFSQLQFHDLQSRWGFDDGQVGTLATENFILLRGRCWVLQYRGWGFALGRMRLPVCRRFCSVGGVPLLISQIIKCWSWGNVCIVRFRFLYSRQRQVFRVLAEYFGTRVPQSNSILWLGWGVMLLVNFWYLRKFALRGCLWSYYADEDVYYWNSF